MSIEAKYEELCEMIRGSSPNWTHDGYVGHARRVDV